MFIVHACKKCKNFISGDRYDPDTWKCKAFPKGIPYETYAYISSLNPPTDCNNGIGYEKKIEENSEYIVPKDYSK